MQVKDIDIEDHLILSDFQIESKREKAFTQLVEKYQQRLYWHVRRLVIEHEDANDILQNVFIKVWRHLHEFRKEANLYTWLYRIATNESLTWIEQQKRRASVALTDEEHSNMGKIESQKGFDANKIEWKLQQAINALPNKQQVVFNLRYYDEMPYEKMAEILDTSVGSLKASYHHAVKKVESFLLNS